ncbi:abl interactor 2 isoform X1 [Stomoxys calcitrans]|uniref:abl interactor 2 isoform X1 n=1 Tax=Stomoxys calcitrans TaxID=35570 RepID=UPI0027E2FA98|nr:abl interactor 2 isoform X1 [Stomoxys calcitrans]XP_013112872.2 abl interactor 2 isoform X1 [Stomoxys calcitrans]XP_013112880.2 abl interactor 2 isoform X1 [Stomoxys calcitrans]XP_013112889.2 abl interactor 2 isoform X1 [Stomoxys calcitrans]XP_013112896.2 abl interactor 2 isoform X1 [Stomoxys calcitrans]XP_013112904.2 abl interactor 2 isoform X1 [Stomoxys calcitrans]XP_013112913.2 abl interactor 2 isoform X1 [Stomoxys calcitrans]XP_013112918.2 abl interactor 2 isoform X1 [Stomoxys calcitr
MTLPTRPAPAPPGSRGQVAAATANASLEQLRLQLQQQQQMQQHQNVTVPKLTIKLPPPPKGPNQGAINGFGSTNSINTVGGSNGGGSITRKFPQARYAPATNWDDSPFDILGGSNASLNGNFKKQPPPRPPPPKVQPKKHLAPNPPAPQQSTNILSNIFHRKKSSRAPTPNSASRIYGSANYGTTSSSTSSNTTALSSSSQVNQHNSWNSAWNGHSSTTTSNQATTNTISSSDSQLISFDSPPSSPTFTQKSNSDCLSVDSFSSDSNFSSPNNGSVSQPESGFEDDFSAAGRSRPATTSPLDPWETIEAFGSADATAQQPRYGSIGTAPVRNLNAINTRAHAANGDNPLCNGKSLLPPAPTLNMPTIIKPKISQKPKAPKPPALAKVNGGVSLYSDLPTPPSPPMPQCAPPPPPSTVNSSALTYSSGSTPTASLLDVISGKVDALQLCPSAAGQMDNYGATAAMANEQPYGIALYDFQSTEEGDLCFRENEKIYLLEQASETWFKGRTRSGCEGIFPANYIEVKVPLSANNKQNGNSAPATMSSASAYSSSSTSSTYNSAVSKTYPKVRSLYNFPAEVEGDLELKENDMVTILYRINEDWLYGEVNGHQGQFPANFLEYVPSNVPMP